AEVVRQSPILRLTAFGELSVFARRAADGAIRRLVSGRTTAACRPGAGIVVPVRRRTGLVTRHDVADLIGINGLIFQQGVFHQLKLVAVLFQDLARTSVALVDDALDLLVDHLGGLTGVRLGTGSRRAP